jgi:signal transduction histidine kinase
MNLFLNAIEAIERSQRPGMIQIQTRVSGEEVIVEVEDNGCGIPKDKLSKVFDPAFTTKNVRVGIGLGLAICYRIVQAHQGDIEIESEMDTGTKVRVRLPVKAPERTPA